MANRIKPTAPQFNDPKLDAEDRRLAALAVQLLAEQNPLDLPALRGGSAEKAAFDAAQRRTLDATELWERFRYAHGQPLPYPDAGVPGWLEAQILHGTGAVRS